MAVGEVGVAILKCCEGVPCDIPGVTAGVIGSYPYPTLERLCPPALRLTLSSEPSLDQCGELSDSLAAGEQAALLVDKTHVLPFEGYDHE
eukprot:5720326-Amphidinium_carterae.2